MKNLMYWVIPAAALGLILGLGLLEVFPPPVVDDVTPDTVITAPAENDLTWRYHLRKRTTRFFNRTLVS